MVEFTVEPLWGTKERDLAVQNVDMALSNRKNAFLSRRFCGRVRFCGRGFGFRRWRNGFQGRRGNWG
jgi:hypothetical protein